jgi:nickel-dependent lactate racemase
MEAVPVPVQCLAMVVDAGCGLKGLFAGGVEDSWSAAADLSAKIHVVTRRKPYRLVLGSAPAMYDELWTAGKVMYKLEKVVADGGTLVIYGPHIREISRSWGREIEAAGYHTRDFFLAGMDKYRHVPRGVLAHLTHVCGMGTFEGGLEKPRIRVVLATAIPEAVCRKVNLGYMNPEGVRLSDYMDREDQGILFVENAGETLYRLEKE